MSMPPGQPPWSDGSQYEPPQLYSPPSAKRRRLRRHPVWSGLIAILGLLLIIAAITGPKPAKVSHTTAAPVTSTPAAHKPTPLKCQAQATSKRPRDHATVTIRVHTVARAKVTATSPLALLKHESATGSASDNGTRILRFHVGDATPGTRVGIVVRVSYRDSTGSCRASFWPRTAAAPSPPATQPAAPPATQPGAPPSSTPAAPATAASCHPLTNGGNCYEPGEYCRNADHGMSGIAGDGEAIICEDNNGWRWEPA